MGVEAPTVPVEGACIASITVPCWLRSCLRPAAALQASAQSPTTAAATSGCTYATCALRVERGLFTERLVHGAAGEELSTIGAFGSGVDVLLSGPDSAVVHAQSYAWNAKRSGIIGIAGGVALGVVMSRTRYFQSDRITTGDVVTTIAGAIAAAVSVPFELRARRELARAIWWYNGALPR